MRGEKSWVERARVGGSSSDLKLAALRCEGRRGDSTR